MNGSNFAQRYAATEGPSGSITDLLDRAARRSPSDPFLQVDDERATFAEVRDASEQLASGLVRLGITPGDRIAFLCLSSLEMAELLFGGWRAAAINVPLNIHLKGDSLAHQLGDSGATLLVADENGLATMCSVADRLPALRHLVVLGEPAGLAEIAAERPDIEIHRFTDMLGPKTADLPSPTLTDTAALIYTSGTTGLSKACILSHRYFHHLGRQSIASLEVSTDDVFITVTPLYHLTAFVAIMGGLLAGVPTVIESQYSATKFLERAKRAKATVGFGVGYIAFTLLQQVEGPSDRDHRLRTLVLAPVAEADRLRFEERFGISLISQVYGQTECSMATASPIGEPRRAGTVGRASPWLQIGIVDHLDQALPAGEVGEIVLRPTLPGVMFDGYWNRHDATIATFRDLWHHTGDLGRLDDDGFLTFVDRKSDSLRRRGENISSFELERTILQHEAIADAAVHAVTLVGAPDIDIKACIVLHDGAAMIPAELFAFFERELPYYAIPRFVEVVDDLPRNVSGRVLKFELRERSLGPTVVDFVDLGLTSTGRRRKPSP